MRNPPPWTSPSVPLSPLDANVVEAKRRLLSRQQSRLDQAKASFLIAASHELRPPLTLIQGYSALLAEMAQAGKLDAAEARAIAKRIVQGTQRLRELIEDVLDATAIQVNALELSLKPLSLSEVIHLALRDLRRLIAEGRHAIWVEGLESLPKIEGDIARLRQAFHNIIGHLLEKTPPGGEIRISARLLEAPLTQVEPPIEVDSSFVEIVVSNISFDLAPVERERLFRQTYGGGAKESGRGGEARKRSADHLGLTIARGVIECHGGRLWVESADYGERRYPGVRFHILLPITAPRRCTPF